METNDFVDSLSLETNRASFCSNSGVLSLTMVGSFDNSIEGTKLSLIRSSDTSKLGSCTLSRKSKLGSSTLSRKSKFYPLVESGISVSSFSPCNFPIGKILKFEKYNHYSILKRIKNV